MRVLLEGREQEFKRLRVAILLRQVTAEREPCAPILATRRDEPHTAILEPLRLAVQFVEALEPIEGEVGAIG
jgi:hypothetical protein